MSGAMSRLCVWWQLDVRAVVAISACAAHQRCGRRRVPNGRCRLSTGGDSQNSVRSIADATTSGGGWREEKGGTYGQRVRGCV